MFADQGEISQWKVFFDDDGYENQQENGAVCQAEHDRADRRKHGGRITNSGHERVKKRRTEVVSNREMFLSDEIG